MKRTVAQVVRMMDARLAPGADEKIMIDGVSTDTRTLERGNLYVPLTGESFDGHDFVDAAVHRGAAALLWQEDRELPNCDVPVILVPDTLAALQKLAAAYRNQLPVRIIGVTGSNGKTTTKDLLASVLSTTYKVHKTKGNLNNHIGLPLTLLQMEENTEMAVIEMGMSGRGEIEFLSRLARPEAAIITNIGEAHLLQLGSRREIAKAKVEILSGLTEGGLFVYHGDEPLIPEVLPEMDKPEGMLTFTFGIRDTNDLYPIATMMDGKGTHFTVSTDAEHSMYLPMLGTHNVINALAAIAVGRYMGVTVADVAAGLKKAQITGMRIEVMESIDGLTILNDAYNASPLSMKAALQLFQSMRGYKRKFAVLGDMLELGSSAAEYHREIGSLLTPDTVDYVYTYGELAAHIALEAIKVYPASRVKAFTDKEELIKHLARETAQKDIILVKGSRGMKLEQVVERLMQGVK